MRQDREGRVRHLTDFLPFDTVVPLRSGTEYYEAALNAVENPSRIGAALRGKSMRTFSAAEFASIARAGLDARALQDWEQGRRVPDRAARVLLTVIDSDPEAVVRALGK